MKTLNYCIACCNLETYEVLHLIICDEPISSKFCPGGEHTEEEFEHTFMHFQLLHSEIGAEVFPSDKLFPSLRISKDRTKLITSLRSVKLKSQSIEGEIK